MATSSLGTLTLDVIAKTRSFTEGMSKAERSARNYRRQVEREMRAANREIRNAARAAKALAGGWVAKEIMQQADAWTTATNRLKLATKSQQELAKAQKDVYEISQITRSSIGATAELYQRLSMNAGKYIKGQKDLANITQTVNKAIKLSGSGAAAGQAAITQFSQALASGVLRGEEFNSVMEQAPRLAKAIADGMGVPVEQLRALAQDGKITADKLIDALRSQKNYIDNEYKNVVPTIADGWTTVGNSVEKAIGEFDKASGASKIIVSSLQSASAAVESFTKDTDELKENINFAKNAAIVLGSVMAGRLVGKLGLATAATKALAFSQGTLRQAMILSSERGRHLSSVITGVTTQTRIMTTATGAARGAFTLLGGPVGILVTAASTNVLAWIVTVCRSVPADIGR